VSWLLVAPSEATTAAKSLGVLASIPPLATMTTGQALPQLPPPSFIVWKVICAAEAAAGTINTKANPISELKNARFKPFFAKPASKNTKGQDILSDHLSER
jgi:hypothetical protein